MNYADILAIAKLENPNDGNLAVLTPIDGSQIARVQTHSPAGAEKMIALGKAPLSNGVFCRRLDAVS